MQFGAIAAENDGLAAAARNSMEVSRGQKDSRVFGGRRLCGDQPSGRWLCLRD